MTAATGWMAPTASSVLLAPRVHLRADISYPGLRQDQVARDKADEAEPVVGAAVGEDVAYATTGLAMAAGAEAVVAREGPEEPAAWEVVLPLRSIFSTMGLEAVSDLVLCKEAPRVVGAWADRVGLVVPVVRGVPVALCFPVKS